MHNVTFALEGAWKVLLAGLVLGAGLPAVFALGVRSLAYGAPGDHDQSGTATAARSHPVGTTLAGVCFAVVLAAVALGILFIVVSGQGKVLSFDHVYPTIVDKP